MLPLFAADAAVESLMEVIKWVGVLVGGGGALKLYQLWNERRDKNIADEATREKTAIDYYKDLAERAQNNTDEAERRCDALSSKMERVLDELGQMKIKAGRKDEYIEYLKEKLTELIAFLKTKHPDMRFSFRDWWDSPGTQPPMSVAPPKPKKNGSSHNLPRPGELPPAHDSDAEGAL